MSMVLNEGNKNIEYVYQKLSNRIVEIRNSGILKQYPKLIELI